MFYMWRRGLFEVQDAGMSARARVPQQRREKVASRLRRRFDERGEAVLNIAERLARAELELEDMDEEVTVATKGIKSVGVGAKKERQAAFHSDPSVRVFLLHAGKQAASSKQ